MKSDGEDWSTKEQFDLIYVLKLNCNEVIFDVCINSLDLYGVPEVGRRFKGKIWMQGSVHPISVQGVG